MEADLVGSVEDGLSSVMMVNTGDIVCSQNSGGGAVIESLMVAVDELICDSYRVGGDEIRIQGLQVL